MLSNPRTRQSRCAPRCPRVLRHHAQAAVRVTGLRV